MTDLAQLAQALGDVIRDNPHAGFFILGIGVGFGLARRTIRFMLGGRP